MHIKDKQVRLLKIIDEIKALVNSAVEIIESESKREAQISKLTWAKEIMMNLDDFHTHYGHTTYDFTLRSTIFALRDFESQDTE